MDDETEGSSSAAQGAPHDPAKDGGSGFGRLIRRLFVARATTDDSAGELAAAVPAAGAVPVAMATPGMANLLHMRVADVAVPKVEIVAAPLDISKDDLVAVFRETGLTRLPVYDGTLDKPVGLINLKDLALRYGFNGTSGRFGLKTLLRPLLFAPPSMPIGVLLQKMQSDRVHMALVIDEYGGVEGLVTIEDLIEQVIGEIEDEHDISGGALWVREGPGVYLAQARAPLEEFEAEIGQRLLDDEEDEEIDTLGGLVFMMTGRVPTRGEVIPHPLGAQFEVIDADPRRIKRLRVRLPRAVSAAG